MKQLIDPYEYGGAVFRVGLADSEEEREACYRLRYRHFCMKSHPKDVVRLDPKDYPDGLEISPEDENSFLLIATKTEGEVDVTVGTIRFNLCSEESPGTIGHSFGDHVFELPDKHKGEKVRPEHTFDGGRWVAHPASTPNGSRQVLVHMLLAEAGLKLSEELGVRHWACIIVQHAAEMGRRNNWPMDIILPGPELYFDDLSEALIIPMDDYNHSCPRLGNLVAERKKA